MVRKKVGQFYSPVADIFEAWIARHRSENTRRAYREGVMCFVSFLGVEWPRDFVQMLAASIKDVRAFRDLMLEGGLAPKTINRRIASLSSFYE